MHFVLHVGPMYYGLLFFFCVRLTRVLINATCMFHIHETWQDFIATYGDMVSTDH